MSTGGLAGNPTEYRKRLGDESDDQIDAWTKELMRDVAVRKGVIKVLEDVRQTARLDENGLKRVFARGGGAPATAGYDAQGRLMVPAISLHCLVTGMRAELPDARARLIDYLVANFDEIVYA